MTTRHGNRRKVWQKKTAVKWKNGESCEKQLTMRCGKCNEEFDIPILQFCGTVQVQPPATDFECPFCHEMQYLYTAQVYRKICERCDK